MMINSNLPWEKMAESSKRRVDLITKHNVYWVTDIKGRFGIFIQSESSFESENSTISLNGIDVIKRNSKAFTGELILLLNENENSQIFSKLCEDLISTIELHNDNDAMVSAVEVRLQRWQELLKKSNNYGMPIEVQMGLLTELSFLKDILLPKIGEEQAINSWVGPDFDKQDFLLDNAVVEIKSYRTSKGPQVSISSAQQLYCEKQPLYLVSYGLTPSDNGKSISDIILEVEEILSNKSKLLLDLFNLKLIDFGYIPDLENEPYTKFLLDSIRVFHITSEFPRITPLVLPNEIVKLKYVIDLSLCINFESSVNSIFNQV